MQEEDEGEWTAGLKQLVGQVLVTHLYLINIFKIQFISTNVQNLCLKESEHHNYNSAPSDTHLIMELFSKRCVK